MWAPAPCVAEVALEQLCEAKHVHPGTSHLFVCPSLMTGRWRKQLNKISDLVVTLPVGTALWDTNQFEPVTIGLTCPLLSRRPWILKRTKWLVERKDRLQGMFREDPQAGWTYLREFWIEARRRCEDL